MEDYSNWLYIIAGIIYFIFQLRGARKKAPQNTGNPNQERTETTPTFEEVLKEILEERKLEKINPPMPKEALEPVPVVVRKPASDPLPSRSTAFKKPSAQSLPSKKMIKAKTGKTEIDTYYTENKSLESTNPSTGLDESYERGSLFKEFQHEEKKENIYSVLLKNPQTLKQAIIASEILKTKF